MLKAYDFLILMTFGQLGLPHPSLAGMADVLHCRLSREAIHRRFTAEAVAFLLLCLRATLNRRVRQMDRLQASCLKPYARVLLFDSTSWDVDPRLRDVFAGSGGEASPANCKLQVGYDYTRGELDCFQLTPGTQPDNAYTRQLPKLLNAKDLALFDQGYFKIQTLQEIEQKGAFFLTRFFTKTSVYEPDTLVPIPLEQLLSRRDGKIHDVDILMQGQGKEKATVRCRLICLRVPASVAEQRRRRLYKATRKKGYTPSQRQLRLCEWTLLITNAPASILPPELALRLYALRWQIELLFKQLKSVLGLHRSHTQNEYRLRCEIIGKLIVAVWFHRLHASFNIALWNHSRREISMDILYKRLQERAFTLSQMLLDSVRKSVTYLSMELLRILSHCMKAKQKSRPTSLEWLEYPLIPGSWKPRVPCLS